MTYKRSFLGSFKVTLRWRATEPIVCPCKVVGLVTLLSYVPDPGSWQHFFLYVLLNTSWGCIYFLVSFCGQATLLVAARGHKTSDCPSQLCLHLCDFSKREWITSYGSTAEEAGSIFHANIKYSWPALKSCTPRQPLGISLHGVFPCCAAQRLCVVYKNSTRAAQVAVTYAQSVLEGVFFVSAQFYCDFEVARYGTWSLS